ncbi:MAG TPA: hypothetical protein PK079_20570 [Leptospiraceae bacterium]|nr:hypothetical protein [Leptospiraceae bacterium]HMW03624.1 hypothetical protein [Leptospiraceae bacterium]HMX31249.1 hypothetical protein [Leptospiraceae bacterium]HMY29455.1 hypothetical protein [Leptospiraceae bacterium]HMZ64742.1 hypothetical protein [Leptospiraceae bacterium]
MNKFISLLILSCLSIFAEELKEETFQFENLRVIKRPASLPNNVIASDFIPSGATILQAVELTNVTGMIPEAGLFLESKNTTEELIKFYENALASRDWRIIQKDNKGNKSVLLGENPSKKVMTILIRDEKDYRVVKVFYRRSGF